MMLAPCLTKTACLCLSLFIQLLFLCSFIISCKFSICLIYRYFPLEMLVRHLEVISCRYEIVPWKDSDSSAQGGWRPWLGASHTSGSWCERGSPPRRLQSIIHCQGLGLAHVGRWAPHIEGDTFGENLLQNNAFRFCPPFFPILLQPQAKCHCLRGGSSLLSARYPTLCHDYYLNLYLCTYWNHAASISLWYSGRCVYISGGALHETDPGDNCHGLNFQVVLNNFTTLILKAILCRDIQAKLERISS